MSSRSELSGDNLEMSVTTAVELVQLSLGCLIDIRQPFELESEGEITAATVLPLFQFKKSLGHILTEEEQEILDADLPSQEDTQHFFSLINALHYDKDFILICVCNSGRRSLLAAQLFRTLGYRRAFSLSGGFHTLKNELRAKALPVGISL